MKVSLLFCSLLLVMKKLKLKKKGWLKFSVSVVGVKLVLVWVLMFGVVSCRLL